MTKFCLINNYSGPKFLKFVSQFFQKFAQNLNFCHFPMLTKPFTTLKIKILTCHKKSPKMAPNVWALFLKKIVPKAKKIAQMAITGHTAN